jgi:hypothetical protein
VEFSRPEVIPQGVEAPIPPTFPEPSAAKPGQPEDIFKEIDKAGFPQSQYNEKPPVPAGPPQPLTALPDDIGVSGGINRKFYLVGLIVLILILAGGGYFAYARFFKSSPAVEPAPNGNIDSAADNNANIAPAQNDNQNLNENANENANLPPEQNQNLNSNTNGTAAIDSDKDGLTDAEEAQLGTDAMQADSDGDGLSDWDEVRVYKTNPLNPDSDGDGYIDGEEVKNGYNPLGPGRMLNINSTSTGL